MVSIRRGGDNMNHIFVFTHLDRDSGVEGVLGVDIGGHNAVVGQPALAWSPKSG